MKGRCSFEKTFNQFLCFFFFFSGFVRKSGMMKIVHEKYKSARKYIDPVISEFQASFGSAIEYNKELESLLSRAQVCMKQLMAT